MNEDLTQQLQELQAENSQLQRELAHKTKVAARALASFQQRALHMEMIRQKNEELDRLAQDLSKTNARLEKEAAERRHAEKELREQKRFIELVLDTEPNVIFVTDKNHNILLINQAAADFYEMEKEQLIEVLNDRTVPPTEDALETLRTNQHVLETKETIYLEEPFFRPNGEMRLYSTIKTPLVREDGAVHVLSISSDITQQKQSEGALKMFAAKLENSNRELEQFAYIASHDLQEPLRKIQAFGDRLEAKYADVLDQCGLDYLARMQGAADRMQRLIIGLLNYSRVTTKAQPFTTVDMNEVARDVLSDLKTRIEQVNGKIEIKDLPQIEADPLQMRQLMQNLISNGLKFHREGQSPVVAVEATCLTGTKTRPLNGFGPGQYCRISITDNGIGFDEKYRDRIFQVFQRLHTRSQYAGTGIGLATCLKIVNRHGGEITVNSRPGVGTTFTVTLPMQQPKGEIKYE